jgi:hypothetical protein
MQKPAPSKGAIQDTLTSCVFLQLPAFYPTIFCFSNTIITNLENRSFVPDTEYLLV